MIIDLHCHSVFSDGMLTPEELVFRAVKIGAKVLSLTDHDTISGLNSLHAAARNHALKVINGVEISVSWRKYDIHILAYNFSCDDATITDLLDKQKKLRVQRAYNISERLLDIGIEDAFAKAAKYANSNNIGRPHFAQVLIDEGKVKEIQQAFDKYLKRGNCAYVASSWLELSKVINTVYNAGGNAVIAHPLKYKLTHTKLRELVCDFKKAGGEGLEVVSGDSLRSDIKLLVEVCQEFSLYASTGSDFHNDKASKIGIGMQRPLPKECRPIWHKWSLNE